MTTCIVSTVSNICMETVRYKMKARSHKCRIVTGSTANPESRGSWELPDQIRGLYLGHCRTSAASGNE